MKKCFRIGCSNEPIEKATMTTSAIDTKTIYFCQACYGTLVTSRIIKDGRVVEL